MPVFPSFAHSLRLLPVAVAVLLLSACEAGPDYVRPTVDTPPAFKENGAWKTAAPSAADSHVPWWESYGDPVLNQLVQDADKANQNIRLAEANYRQAQALVASARAGLYPTLNANVGVGRALSNTTGTVKEGNDFTPYLSASWIPDFWGGVRRSIEANTDSAQASADDLANAHLSIQAAVVQDYFQLRITDQQRDLYASTTEAYSRALKLTQAQHSVGVAQLSDVALAESQLTSAQATAADLDASRATLEHAIAILTNRPPSNFSLAPGGAEMRVPASPVGVPSELLERRPDIAAAERRAALANANIGVARAAYYPNIVLNAAGGYNGGAIAGLFDTPERIWSLGATLAQTLFDGGLRRARDAQAVAAYDAAVSTYKLTVLTGFQQVEDNLATLRVLDRESDYQAQAVKAGQTAERLALAQYRGGTTTYLTVVTAQTLSLTNQRTAVQLRGRQLAASVSLITATGGGFNANANTASAAPVDPSVSTPTSPATPAPATTSTPTS